MFKESEDEETDEFQPPAKKPKGFVTLLSSSDDDSHLYQGHNKLSIDNN